MGNPVVMELGEMSDADLIRLWDIVVGSGGFFTQFAGPIDYEQRRRVGAAGQPPQVVSVDFASIANLDESVLTQLLDECQTCRDQAADAGPAVTWFFDQLVTSCTTELEDRQRARQWQQGHGRHRPGGPGS